MLGGTVMDDAGGASGADLEPWSVTLIPPLPPSRSPSAASR